jgi:biotin operon repressor
MLQAAPASDLPRRFNGADYDHQRDSERLTRQHERVLAAMKDYLPHTLGELATTTGDPEASISAQIRHLRKARFGGHTITKTHLGNGLYAYQLMRPTP